jgi:YesN/AraC family two-component response regulator
MLHGANPAHVVIFDIIMPGKEGIETIIEIRRTCPDLDIIAM